MLFFSSPNDETEVRCAWSAFINRRLHGENSTPLLFARRSDAVLERTTTQREHTPEGSDAFLYPPLFPFGFFFNISTVTCSSLPLLSLPHFCSPTGSINTTGLTTRTPLTTNPTSMRRASPNAPSSSPRTRVALGASRRTRRARRTARASTLICGVASTNA